MYKTPMYLPKYIPMNYTTNYEDIAPLKDDYIFLFDIDHTLYKMKEDMHKHEVNAWIDVYNKLKGNKDSVPTFKEILQMSLMYGGAFYKVFNVTAKQADDLREIIDYSQYIPKDTLLRNKLISIPHRKWCFTNGLKSRAKSLLTALNIENCFEGVICMDDDSRGDFGKPFKNSFIFVEKLFDVTRKDHVIFFDDNVNNIKVSNEMGWKSILVGKEDNLVDLIDKTEEDIKLGPER